MGRRSVGIVILASTVWYLLQRHENRRVVYEASYQQYANTKGSLAPGASSDNRRSIADPKSYREEWREERDLEAQREMAEWTLPLLVTSIISAAIGMVGLIALFISLNQTRTVIKHTREIGEAQTVAYPSINSFEFILGERNGDHYKIALRSIWKNAGNTPAFDFGIRYIVTIRSPSTAEVRKEYDANIERGLIRIDPGAEDSCQATPDDVSFSGYIKDMKEGTVRISVDVIGSYRDAFSRKISISEHFRSSAIHYHPNTNSFGGPYIFNIKDG